MQGTAGRDEIGKQSKSTQMLQKSHLIMINHDKVGLFFESLNHDSRDSRIYIYNYIYILLYCKTLCNVLMFDVHVFSV